jgi:hypothetical protein
MKQDMNIAVQPVEAKAATSTRTSALLCVSERAQKPTHESAGWWR